MSLTAAAPGGSRPALAAGLVCYLSWGFLPLLFIAIGRAGVSPWEILAQRVLWAVPVAGGLVLVSGQAPQVRAAFAKPRLLALLGLSAALIAANWSLFIWAVNNGHNLDGSLGYFINPLLAMAAGALLFGERIGPLGYLAIGLAALGVALQAMAIGHMPLIALALAVSFCAYGVIRKRVDADAQTGLFIECLMLAGPGLALAWGLQAAGHGLFGRSVGPTLLLILCGPATVIPLFLFSWAARRLPFSIVGVLQFVTPSISFVIGLYMGEPMTPLRAASFVFIGAGAAVFAYGAWRAGRQVQRS